jgi:hypothetical protein
MDDRKLWLSVTKIGACGNNVYAYVDILSHSGGTRILSLSKDVLLKYVKSENTTQRICNKYRPT